MTGDECHPSASRVLCTMGCQSLDLAHGLFDVARIPMDAVAMLTYREFVVSCVYEWRHATGDGVARHLLEQLVAGGASREGEAACIEWIARHYLANLVAEKMAFDIEHVRSGAQALIACQQRAFLLARAAKNLSAGERWIAKHISTHQPQPSRKPNQHAIGRELGWSLYYSSGILHHSGYSIAKQQRPYGNACAELA